MKPQPAKSDRHPAIGSAAHGASAIRLTPLAYLDRISPNLISLGLDNVNKVKQSLRCRPEFPVITVSGTNGKGSTCAMLEAVLSAAGYRVGCYTSPHLLRFNERIRISQALITDEELNRVFARVEQARGATPLTYFEFGTLSAMMLFIDARVDVAILEVGLGGRLDAVNAFDADCSVITSVALDHMEYLGTTREQIAFEKAGIMRKGRPAICAEPDAPDTMRAYARAVGADFLEIGKDFRFEQKLGEWEFVTGGGKRLTLPYPALRGGHQLYNASAVIAALDTLAHRLPVALKHIRAGLLHAQVAGRFQLFPGEPSVILDVAHNPHAAAGLAGNLENMPCDGKTIAVFAMLKDKDIAGVIEATRHSVDEWLVADIQDARGATAAQLKSELEQAGVATPVLQFAAPEAAYEYARYTAECEDRIVVFGSFRTVAAILERLNNPQASAMRRTESRRRLMAPVPAPSP